MKKTNILPFNKKDSNVVSLDLARNRRKRRGMTEEEFRKKYMSNSVVSLFGDSGTSKIKIFNGKKKN